MRKIKKDIGITLIALIITIIVLLILAGIAIAALAGDNGIITQAKGAKDKHNAGQADEEEKLNSIYDVINSVEKEIENGPKEDIAQVSAGDSHTVLLMNDGTIKVSGDNYHGQLGLGDNDAINTFETVSGISGVKQVSAGYYHTVILMNDGTIKVCGSNGSGQLGLGDDYGSYKYIWSEPYVDTFETVLGISGVKQVSAGYYHTVILMNDGTIKVSGSNGSGELGLGDNDDRDEFETVPGISGVKRVSAGGSRTILLMNDGTIKVCGNNEDGELGLGDNDDRDEFETVSGITEVKQVADGDEHTVLLMNDGTIKVCGRNSTSQLGLGDINDINTFETVSGISGVKQVAAEYDRTVLLMNDGTIKVCGAVGAILGYDYDGYNWDGCSTSIDEFAQVPEISDVKQVGLGRFHTVLLMNDGTIKGCGMNSSGELGLGDWTDREQFETVPGINVYE